ELDPRPEKLRCCRIRLRAVGNRAEEPLRLGEIARLEITGRQLHEEAFFPGAAPDNLLQERASLLRPSFPKIRASYVILCLYLCSLRRFLFICAGIFNVTQGRELLHEFVSLGGIQLLVA